MATKVYLIPEIGFVQVPDDGTREYLIPEGGFFSEGDVTLTNYSLSCSSGSFSLSGTAVEFLVPSNIKANTGSLVLSGTAVDLEYGRKLSITSGALTLAGTDVALAPKYINKFDTDPSCKALWRFESGALCTDSIGNNDLTNSGVAESTGTYFEGTCAADFEYGDNDYLVIDDADLDEGFPLKSGDTSKLISVAFWLKPESSLAGWIFCKGNDTSNDASFSIACSYYASGWVELCIRNGYDSGEHVENWYTTEKLSNGQVCHVTVMHDGINKTSTLRIYYYPSGTTRTQTVNWAHETSVTDAAVAIGCRSDLASGMSFDGLLDEMAVFNRLLSVDEADAIRQGSFVCSTYRLNIASGSFALAGTATTLRYNKLSADSGEYVAIGTDVSLRVDRKLSCSKNDFSLTGTAVGLVLGKSIVLGSGSYSLLGSVIGTPVARKIVSTSGEYNLSGTDVSLEKGSSILLESTNFSLSGNDVDFIIRKTLSITSGTLTLTGTNVNLRYNIKDYVMAADSGIFILNGKPVTLKFSGGNPSTLALRINTKLAALSQYSNFNFTSVCYYNGVLLGANNGGIFSVNQDTDLGDNINSFFEIFGADFNSNYRKFIRSSTISGVFDKISVSVVADSVECTSHDSLYDATVEQKSVSIDMNKDDRGKYIGIKISNIDGSDFSIDGVSLVAGLVQKYSPSEAIVGRSKLAFSGATISAGGS